jgi:hypothetical protein
MDTETPEDDIPIIIEEPVDAADLIIGEIVVEDENYDEIETIVLDLRRTGKHDCWYA